MRPSAAKGLIYNGAVVPLTPGARLGPYEITGTLGAGGMGEVYRARDTRLKRDVALKILPDSFAADPERVARFQREAEVVAALNHPNIAGIHGLEESGDVSALVLELVEGPTLADRVAQGPIPIAEALSIARQITDALEVAHEQGIVHRDLKPANIKLRPDGTVKVLDFGLAKLAQASGPGRQASAFDVTASPTITSPAMATGIGMILGTAAYMAPEQARGKTVDRRADIWAFGCVLFEMLTGKRAFEGEDVSDTLAEVLKREPDWAALPAATPEPIRRLLRRCLTKDPKNRLPDIAVARLEIAEALIAPVEAPTRVAASSSRRMSQRLAWVVAFVFLATSIALAIMHFRPSPPSDAPTTRFSVVTPPARGNPNNIAVSPDGRFLVFTGFDENGKREIWLRPMNAVASRPLPGTDDGVLPFWSPDSRFIAFFANGRLKKVDVVGGPAQTLCDAGTNNPGGTWSQEGTVLFGSNDGIYRVSASGGSPSRVTTLDPGRQEINHNLPAFLPDGRHFLYRVRSNKPEFTGIYLGSLGDTATSMLMRSEIEAEFAPPGFIVFVLGNALMAQAFDERSLKLTGEAFPIADQVSNNPGTGQAAFSISATGVLAYRPTSTGAVSQLEWVDRAGKQLGVVGDAGPYADVELSPDGKMASVSLRDVVRGTRDEWIVDLARGIRIRFTFDPAEEYGGKWSPGGDRIAYLRGGDHAGIYVKPSSGAGTERLLVESNQTAYPDSWSPDGRFLLYEIDELKTSWNLWVQPLTPGAKPWPLVRSEFRQEFGQFSPDGRWVAYHSNESGRSEVYVTPFVDPGAADADRAIPGAKWQISSAGGTLPRWRRDGREVFYLGLDNRLMAAEVDGAGSGFKIGAVRPLFATRPATGNYAYDVSADGQRFLLDNVVEQPGSESITLVFNWTSEIKR